MPVWEQTLGMQVAQRPLPEGVRACQVPSMESNSLRHYGPWDSCDLGILQARILEWVAVSSSRGSSQSKDRTLFSFLSCVGRQVLYHWCHLGWMLFVLPTVYSAMLGYWSCLCYCIEKSYDKPRQHLKKQIHYFADKGPSSQGYALSSRHLWM